jgi:multiple sugar transport system substrate-binding protein
MNAEEAKMSFDSRRLWPKCAVICLLAISLLGCASLTPTPEPIIISFAHARADTDLYEGLAFQFNEQYPHLTVELRPKEWDDLNDLRAGDADVLVGTAFTLRRLWEQDGLLSLDPFIQQDRSFDLNDFYPGTVELFTGEGRVWALPSGVNLMVMYYNQDLFDRRGVAYPDVGWTWNDFLNVSLALRDPDTGMFGYALAQMPLDPIMFIYQHGGRIFDDLQNPTRVTFDDPLTIEALEWYAKLIHEYNVAPTPDQLSRWGDDQTAVYRGIVQGRVGMWMGYLSDRGGLMWPVRWRFNWGMAPLPHEAQAATMADVEGYAISSQTRHADAAWRWIAFLSQQMGSRLIPARKSLAESVAYEQSVGSDVAAVARASIEAAVIVDQGAVVSQFEEAVEVLTEALQEIISGNSEPQAAMERAQQRAEQ